MLDSEVQKLTAAIEALTVQIKNQNVARAAFVKHAEALVAHADTNTNTSHLTAKPQNRNGDMGSVTTQQIAGGTRTVRKINDTPTPLDPHPTTSKENLKDLALQISRADSNAKSEIVSILNSHGAKTITSLSDDPGVLHDVFARLTNLAAKIAEQSQ